MTSSLNTRPWYACGGNHFSRRDFLRVGSLSFLGINLSQFMQLEQVMAAQDSVNRAKAKSCILLWLDGGPSQMDTWDPKTNSPFKPIQTNVDGIQISELLPRSAKMMDRMAVVRSMHGTENNHRRAQGYMLTGHRPNPAMEFPSFGSIVTKELGALNDLPPNVMISGLDLGQEEYFKGKFIGAQYDPMIIPGPRTNPATEIDAEHDYRVPDLSLPKSLTDERIENRRRFLELVDEHYREHSDHAEFNNIDTFTDQAWNMVLSSKVREAFDLESEPEKMHDDYGRYPFGQSVLIARRLVEAGCRFVTAAGYRTQAWDSHGQNDVHHRDYLCPTLDQTLPTLLDDLEDRGLLESTLVVVTGEFGRTPEKNPYEGRDHWPGCWSTVLAGGGINGGQVIGSTDEQGAFVADRPISVGDLHATIYKAMGIDWTKEYMHPVGRPIKIANNTDDETGVPIPEIV